MEFRLPADTSARLDAETFSGSIENELGPDGQRTSQFGPGRRLDYEEGEGDGLISIDTFSGSIEIDVAEIDEEESDEDDLSEGDD